MYVLDNLWRGNISPNKRFFCSDSEYKKLFSQLVDKTEQLRNELSPDNKKLCDEIESLQLKLIDISEQDTFVVGFRLGARLILDIVGNYKGQFKTLVDL